MRLHSLEITAFGPFANTETVDFDALGADGLFLLHGKTGAGKTTVLDAVAFALYGTVPGARKEGKRLLSDHAPAGSVPKVTLEVTLAGRRMRIVRSPEFQRNKLRGVGTTKQNAKASLTWLDGGGQNLTRIDEIGDAVGALLGMSADQFFQVVLLPQGEFARFLRADSDERGNLLERLFDTARFGEIEEWFARERKIGADALDLSNRSIDKLRGQISTASGVPEELDREPMEWAGEVLGDAKIHRATAEDVLAERDRDARAADALLADAVARRAAQQRAMLARAQLTEYDAGARHRTDIRTLLAGSAAAGPITSASTESDRARTEYERIAAALDAARARLRALADSAELDAELCWPPTEQSGTSDRAVVAESIREWTTLVAALADLRRLAAKADSTDAEIVSLHARRAELDAAVMALEETRASLPTTIAAVDDALVAAVGRRAELPALEAAAGVATRAVESAIALATARKKLTGLQRVHDAARGAHLDAREAHVLIRTRRLDGMAAELAGDLHEGSACAVCGATEHPAPAQPTDEGVSEADERAAAAREDATSRALDEAAAALTPVARTIDALVERVGDRATPELAATLDSATDALKCAREAADTVPELTERVAHLRTQETRTSEQIASAQSQNAAVAERIAILTASVADMRASVAASTAPGESIERHIADTEALISATSELSDRRAAYVAASTASTRAAERTRQLVLESGFDSAADASRAVVTAERVRVLEAELATAEEIRGHAQRVLAEPDIAAVAGTEVVELEPFRERAAEAALHLRSAVAGAAEWRRRTEQLEELTTALWSTIGHAAPMKAKYDELAALADVVAGRGQNARKMSLRSYVLASRLEEVAESASARLRRMSSGRYEFVHSDEAESRGRRGGLGIDIRDDYTGVIRSAKTLSGGESFLASLALALGLADVVAAESGGVVLDTMFIDEGFGTLDADTLESVMGVLDELRAGGRVVGIVSHVDEMRQRIPSRLHVIHERGGSSLQVVAS